MVNCTRSRTERCCGSFDGSLCGNEMVAIFLVSQSVSSVGTSYENDSVCNGGVEILGNQSQGRYYLRRNGGERQP